MTTATRRIAPFLAIAAVTALGSCSEGDAPAARTTTVTATETVTPEAADRPAEKQLTTGQITRALPKPDEVPAGYERDTRHDDKLTLSAPADTSITEPAVCQALTLDSTEARAWHKKHLKAIDGYRYTLRSRGGSAVGQPRISAAILSYDEPYPETFFNDAGKAIPQCTEFTRKASPDGTAISYGGESASAPTLGDQSYAVRRTPTDLNLALDQYFIRSGHNVIAIDVVTTEDDFSSKTQGKIAQGILADLNGTS